MLLAHSRRKKGDQTMKILINLIGEQPIPNLLPALFLKPDKIINLYTDRTTRHTERLQQILQNSENIKTSPYDFSDVFNRLEVEIAKHSDEELIFNISGGTKLMSIALFQFAVQNNSEAIYLQSERNKSVLYSLKEENGILTYNNKELPELIDIDTFLKVHIGKYHFAQSDKLDYGMQFENEIIKILRENNFEIMQGVKPNGEGDQLEIDAVIKLKGTNNIAIAEIKVGDKNNERPKKGIDQLSTAGGREYLGIYTKKFLILRNETNNSIKKLAKAHNIIVIDKLSTNKKNELTETSKNILIKKLTDNLS